MNDPLRVALATHYPQDPARIAGGIQAVSFRLVEELRKMPGLEIHVIHCHSDVSESRTVAQGNVTLHFLAQTRRRIVPNMTTKIGQVAGLLRRLAPDVVHAHEHNLALAGVRAGCATIWTIHGVLAAEKPLYRGLFNRLNFALAQHYDRQALAQSKIPARGVRCVTTVSRYVLEACRDRAAVETWQVIENPAPPAYFDLPRRPIPGRVLLPAAIIPLKDPLSLVRAAALARDRVPELHVRLAGSLADTKYVTEVQAEIGRLGLAETFSLLGPLAAAALAREYSEAAVVALPSRQEVTPMVVIEAMAAGVPVVATAVGGVPYMIEDRVTGLTVPPAAPAALAEALGNLLSQPELAGRLGQAARAVAHERFRADRIAARYLALYEAVR